MYRQPLYRKVASKCMLVPLAWLNNPYFLKIASLILAKNSSLSKKILFILVDTKNSSVSQPIKSSGLTAGKRKITVTPPREL